MSDGNRGKRPEAVAADTFCALALLAGFVLIYVLGDLNGREAERREQTPAAYGESAKTAAQRACAGREPAAVFECVYEHAEASKEQAYADQDLSAQQRAATSALAAAFIAFLTLCVTIVGVWFVKRTLEATLEAVEDTGRATDAMFRQNELAELAQRPWVTIDVSVTEEGVTWDDKGMHFLLDITVKNVGSSLAQKVHIRTLCFANGLQTARVNEFFHEMHDAAKRAGAFGDLLVPGESELERHVQRIGTEDFCHIMIDGRPTVAPCISISATYSALSGREVFQTARTYMLTRGKKEHPGRAFVFDPEEGDVPTQWLGLETMAGQNRAT